MTPYYADDTVTLYHGDCREILPALGQRFDCAVTDPPYGETSLTWDRWPSGWLAVVAEVTSSLWCFGSMRMFLDRRDEFAAWKLSQDVVWEKATGTSFAADRFKRVHEITTHWYRGGWNLIHHQVPRVAHRGPDKGTVHRPEPPLHTGTIGTNYWVDDGTRLARSVLKVPNMRGKAIHPTEKPVGILSPLIEYACPPGGVVVDVFAGSCSTGVAARMSGRRAVLIERDEAMCEKAVTHRLQQDVLPLDVTA